MSATVIHPSTSHGAHAGPPGSDPHQIINDLRGHNASVADLERQLAESRHEAERRASMEIGLRNALAARNEKLAELGLRLVRADEALADLAAHAWRLEQENTRLSADNRRLRDLLGRGRGRHRGRP